MFDEGVGATEELNGQKEDESRMIATRDPGSKLGSTFAPKVEERKKEIANALDPSLRWEDTKTKSIVAKLPLPNFP